MQQNGVWHPRQELNNSLATKSCFYKIRIVLKIYITQMNIDNSCQIVVLLLDGRMVDFEAVTDTMVADLHKFGKNTLFLDVVMAS